MKKKSFNAEDILIWKKNYIAHAVWYDNDFLVQPEDSKDGNYLAGTKRCSACRELKYTSEFFDMPVTELFADDKLPICTECWRQWSKREKRLITNVLMRCTSCKTKLPLHMFNGDTSPKGTNRLKTICKNCSKADIK